MNPMKDHVALGFHENQAAQALIAELSAREIYLRLEDGRIRWTAMTERGVRIAQIREIKRLDLALKRVLGARQRQGGDAA